MSPARILVVLTLLAIPTLGHAQRAVVMNFGGPGGSQARSAAVRAASRSLQVVPQGRAASVGSPSSRQGRRQIARELNLDFIIMGRVTGRGRGAHTEITVFGSNGRELASENARRPIGQAGRADVTRATSAAIRTAQRRGGGRSNRRERDNERRRERDDDDEDEAREERRRRARERREREEERREEAAEERRERRSRARERARERREEREERAERRRRRRRDRDEDEYEDDYEDDEFSDSRLIPKVMIRLGVDARTRDVTITLTDSRRRNFEASLYPEVTGRIEAHPLIDRDAALRGLYLQLDVAFAVGLRTLETDPANPMGERREIETNAWRFLASLGYLIPAAEDRVRVGLLVGFGHDRFSLAENQTLPSTSYNTARIGLVGSFGAYGTLMQTRLDIGYRFLLGAGDLSTAFGETTTGGALDVGLSLGGFADVGFSYQLRFGYSRYSLRFAGPATDFTATKGTDSAVNLGIQLGWAFH